ncbi:DMT family transporter [Streptomyces sp. NPDC003077]|uniref:DMT family transporter n=1 Tax=Streptomyces sp. NPDC003077 TaxID=3154443 RepID=UPI00339FF52D
MRFGALSLIWGFSFLFIKLGMQTYVPLHVTLGRMVFGTAVLLVVLVFKRERLPRFARTWGHLTVAAFFLNALPFSLFAYSELTIPSTLAGICNATSPLWGMALSLVALSEDRPTRRRVAGLGLGFLGVLTVLGAWQGFAGTDLTGTAMALGASLSYPIGWIYVRRTLGDTEESHLSIAGTQLLLATLQLGVVSAFFTSLPHSFSIVSLLAVAALGALGTGFAFLLQYGLVAEVGPTTAQMVTYFVPVIAAAAGVLVLNEEFGWNTPVGALIVLAGAALTQTRPRRTVTGTDTTTNGTGTGTDSGVSARSAPDAVASPPAASPPSSPSASPSSPSSSPSPDAPSPNAAPPAAASTNGHAPV